MCQCTLLNKALRMTLQEFLQHSKESRGVLGQACKQLGGEDFKVDFKVTSSRTTGGI